MQSEDKRELILECENISKFFGGTKALDDVSFSVAKGEVHALLGENGAGKSTLMKIIIGLYKRDAGKIFFNGDEYSVNGPADAISKGISMIHQELNPEPYLSIAESIFLNREDTRGGIFLNKKETNRKAQEILDKFNFRHNAKKHMEKLTLAQCQIVEIIKAVSFDAKLIIMDEPTSSLDSEETETLFGMIRDLKKSGVSIIYITHRMDEIFAICDYVSVFRDGKFIDSCPIHSVTKDSLISMMVGREVKQIFPKQTCEIGDVVFKVENLYGEAFSDISFEVRAGEILGISGLVGSGRSETMLSIFGMDKLHSGQIYLNGKQIKIRNPRDAINYGICMVNENRKDYGLCLFRSIRENIALPTLKKEQKGLTINNKKEIEITQEVSEKLRVKTSSIETDAYNLSGGNQQKVVLSKWILANPKVLILDEPTRGVDVGAKSEIHSLMCQFAATGMAIIMISSELPEVMGMSDRILIYHEGKLNGEISRDDILNANETQETILAKEFGQ